MVSLCIVAFFFIKFTVRYIGSPAKHAQPMLYGDLEAAYWLSNNAKEFTKITVSRSLSEPQIFIAFAEKWDPSDYQKETIEWRRYREENLVFLDQFSSYQLGKYRFGSIQKDDLIGNNALLVGRPNEFPDGMEVIKRFSFPNGEPDIVIVKVYPAVYADNAVLK